MEGHGGPWKAMECQWAARTLPTAVQYMRMTSLIVGTRSRIGPGAGMARWRTSVDAAVVLSPTRSTIVGAVRMYVGATSRTHAGRVALKRHVWRSSRVHLPRISCRMREGAHARDG